MMNLNSYTFFIAGSNQGSVRKVRVPFYVVHLLVAFAVVGGITTIAAVGSYSRMLWKVANYNALRSEQVRLKEQYTHLQSMVTDTNKHLNSLQSLATEVAMTYGIAKFRQTPFGLSESTGGTEITYRQSVDQFNFLVKNATAVALTSQGMKLVPGRSWQDLASTPSLWPVMGQITGSFGDRLDPFSGEGAFHAGVDISSTFGDPVRASADGLVVSVENRAGYGRVVVIEHGFGLSTWYGHMSGFNTRVGAQVKRGDVIGYVGTSGRATGPHVHYEVRSYGAPVNPWRYLRGNGNSAD